MELNNIEVLVEKYENGKTNLNEEQQLKIYFSQENIAPHLEAYRIMFTYFRENKQEQFTKAPRFSTRKSRFYKWIPVAAALLILMGIYYTKTVNNNDLGTFNDPEIALIEVSKSLEMISEHFNKGAATVGYLEEVNRGTATLGYLNEIENTVRIIFKPYN
ncbi:hypothetical protein ACFFU9_14325 [Mariniflexile ostreae]|uniref:Uncharacterized protein n=1 Tax=Mariniflexile ostreae TaxID=1520892 RepID=A0ABV5FF05_9FLAO